VNTDEMFLRQGVQIKCEHDVAVKAIDWRGMLKNNGVVAE
jgi:hypothetical protein